MKLNLTDILTVTNAPASINGNNDLIEEAFENTLSRDGTSPNEMLAPLDMNSQRIINLPAPQATTDPVRLGDLSSGATGLAVASQAEAEAGLSSAVLMTPLETKHVIQNGAFFTQSVTGAVSRSFLDRGRDFVSVFDFFTAAQRNDVTSRARTLDVGTAVNSAIANLPAGTVLTFPPGDYRIETVLLLNRDITLFSNSNAGSRYTSQNTGANLWWYGDVGPMCFWGGLGTIFYGSGIIGLSFIGNGGANIATYGLYIKDLGQFVCRNVTLENFSVDAMVMTNTAGQFPTGFGVCEDITILLRNGVTQTANGIHLAGTDGVTLCSMSDIRIEHANGSGVLVDDIGDAFTWYNLYTFRAASESGIGVWFASSNASAVCSFHTFVHPVCTGGFRFDKAGIHEGTRIINACHVDLPTSVPVLTGKGCQDVYCTTQLGGAYGLAVLEPNPHVTPLIDAMRFIRQDSTNKELITWNGHWKYSETGTAALSSINSPGGGVNITTSGSSGDLVAVYDTPTLGAGNGWYDGMWPVALCQITPQTSSNVKYRIGWIDGTGDTPTNGAYIELDPAVNSAHWQLVCRSGGTETRTNASVGILSNFELKFYLQSGQLFVLYRVPPNRNFAVLGSITTNVPTTGLSWVYLVKTQTAATARLDVFVHRCGGIDENSLT